MRIVIINSVYGVGSTGKICAAIANQLKNEGHTVKIVYGRSAKEDGNSLISMVDQIGFYGHVLGTRLFDHHAFSSKRATARLLKELDVFDPQLIWLHNIHGYYINAEMLFAWIKSRPSMKVRWTLHDCWSFTGHCSHFILNSCDKWKTGCKSCNYKQSYPKCIGISDSCNNYTRKKLAFSGVNDMELITPSKWLADLTRESFLCEYPVTIVHNTIDSSIFHRVKSNFKKRYNIENRYIILGVSNIWSKRKGFDDFIALSKIMSERFVIVLVGVSKKQKRLLPNNCIGITRTTNQSELAEIYSSADCFFNPTYEDNYPTVNLEAEACGTPVITYATGGAPETIKRADSVAVKVGDIDRVARLIQEKYN